LQQTVRGANAKHAAEAGTLDSWLEEYIRGVMKEEQKRDIFYNNAVRFLRLDEKKLGLNSAK
jgi:hypothetical protein